MYRHLCGNISASRHIIIDENRNLNLHLRSNGHASTLLPALKKLGKTKKFGNEFFFTRIFIIFFIELLLN